MARPMFSIVLPTYNRFYSLKKIFLPSLAIQSFDDYELIIVDDNSSDETRSYFNSFDFAREFPKVANRVKYFRNKKNKGAPGSRNIGAREARADWIYIVEDDVEIKDKEFLKKAKQIIEDLSDNISVVCPMRRESISKGYYKNPKNSFARLGVLSGEVYIDPSQEYSGFAESAQASSFIRTAIFNKHQEDEHFFGNTFRDESDLYIRIAKDGGKIWYCGDILQSTHRNDFAVLGGQKKVNKKSIFAQEYMIWKNHYYYLKKNYGLAWLRILFFVCVRMIKIFANFTRLHLLKNFLALIRF